MDSKPKFLLIGPPGAGKTVIASKITDEFGIPFIKVGSILRDLPSTSEHFTEINQAMEKGMLAPNKIVADVIKTEINKLNDGFVLDGWGRQLSDLDIYLPKLDYVVFLDCPKEICKNRILNRVVCKIDNSIYSYSDEVCSLCGGTLEKRTDDTELTFQNRWKIFEEKTLPVIEYFSDKGILIRLDASKSIMEILDQLKKNL